MIHFVEEHQFWLEVLEDHAWFIHDFLSSSEARFVKEAAAFITAFGQLLEKLKKLNPNLRAESSEMIAFAREVSPIVYRYYQFEGHLQKLRLQNKVNLNLSPTYLNGTLNENQEYIRLLSFYVRGAMPEELSLGKLLDLWLEDQLGHALLLAEGLDAAERGLIEQCDMYTKRFNAHMLKNRQMKRYLRFMKPGFPAQIKMAEEVAESVKGFNEVVKYVIVTYKEEEVLSKLTLRFLHHHLPETCYFLKKLASFSTAIDTGDCSIKKSSLHEC